MDDGPRVALTPTDTYQDQPTDEVASVITLAKSQEAEHFAKLMPQYKPTPLPDAGELTGELKLASIAIKHEGRRLPTKSFKTLGPPYALACQLQQRLALTQSDLAGLAQGELKSEVSEYVACAATSGNHGRALAWAATQFGCRCRIYLPQATGAYREQMIQRFGAETVRVAGNYDETVEQVVLDSDRDESIVVGDGAPNTEVIRQIIFGYSVVGAELVAQLQSDHAATHVFVPAGSGSLASGVIFRLWEAFGSQRPKIVVVQPHSVDSGYHSCLQGQRVPSQGNVETLMDGLAVEELSAEAWPILKSGAFAFITIAEQVAISTLHRITELAIGETGVAALAGLVAASADGKARERLQLDETSRVVVLASEGVTDPPVMERLLAQG